jgi:hypothetical protein
VTTKEEYILYEQLHNNFLQHNGHAKAALEAGGILWRLCIEFLEVESALSGPQEDVSHYLRLELDNSSYVCDTLFQHEKDLICGVYKVLGE